MHQFHAEEMDKMKSKQQT